jgi:hypothetical protein
VLFFAVGLRTPLLALLALRRAKNLAVVVLPYGAGLLIVTVLGPRLSDADRIGLVAVAIAPALLAAPSLAGLVGGRMDRAGALLVGTIGMWWILSLVRGSFGPAQNAMLAFIVGAGITSAVPMLPEIVRTVVRRIGDAAFIVLAAIAMTGAGAFDATNGLAAILLFVAIVGAVVLAARIGGVDTPSALAGAGSRDPAVATALAVAAGGSTAIPLYSGILLLALSTALARRNRRKPR